MLQNVLSLSITLFLCFLIIGVSTQNKKAATPPAAKPPTATPPAATQQAVKPPAATPPTAKPPTATPPAATQQAAKPPTATPPAATQQAAKPPAATPPAAKPTASPPAPPVKAKIPPRKGHLKPIGESGPMKKIDVVEGFVEPKRFGSEYVMKSRPVLMKNAAKSIPAFSLWTDNYLRSKTPDGPAGDVDVEKGKKETREGGGLKVNFKTFLDVYNTSDIYMVQDAPSFLKPDLIIPWSIQCEEYKTILETTVVWFSSGGTKSVLHNDGFENINCLYRGRKRLVFIDINKYKDIEETILDNRNGGYSSMNVEAVDLDKYPFMQNMEFYEGSMEPGDCIYIPFMWIHHVESFGSNLAVNVWWSNKTDLNLKSCNKQFDKTLSLDKFHFHMLEDSDDQDDEPKESMPNYPPESDEVTLKTILNNVDIIVYGEDKKYTEMWKGDFIEYFRQDLDKKKKCLPIIEQIFKLLDSNKDSVLSKKDNYRSLSENKKITLLNLARSYDKAVSSNNSGALRITLPLLKQNSLLPEYEDAELTKSYIDQNVYADFSNRIVQDEL